MRSSKESDRDFSNRWMEECPPVVRRLLRLGAYLVGSQATEYGEGRTPSPTKDWDVMVPFSIWRRAAMCVPRTASLNGNRGFRFEDDGRQIDVWADDLSRFLTEATSPHHVSARPGKQYVVSPYTRLVIAARISEG